MDAGKPNCGLSGKKSRFETPLKILVSLTERLAASMVAEVSRICGRVRYYILLLELELELERVYFQSK